MFTPLGLFEGIPCPQGERCALLRCLFSHESNEPRSAGDSTPKIRASGDDGPPSKRAKLDQSAEKAQVPCSNSSDENTREMTRRQSGVQGISELQSITREVTPPAPSHSELSRSSWPVPSKATTAVPSKSNASKTESKPNNAAPSESSAKLPPRKAPKETLNPRMLTKAPTSHVGRTAILKKLHGAMTAHNEKLRKDKNSANKCFILTPDELVTMALDEEEKTAKDNPGVYGNVIKLRIVKLSKMGIEEWVKEVMDHLNTRYYSIKPIQKPDTKPSTLATGMTVEEELATVPFLITPITGYEQYGYVTKAPTETEIAVAKEGVDKSNGWEKCDRCGGRFQVFPGRREDGVLTTGGTCTYHPFRPLYPQRKKTDHVTGSQEPYYPCCNEPMGTSSGCTKADSHVFKVSETKRLASVLQFETTPRQPEKGPLEPVCVDCEMGYTSMGMELIRLTAVSWPEGRDLLDVLVRPIGEVLDFNSRFSGVFQQHYIDAKPYGTTVSTADLPTKEGMGRPQPPLQLVKSPAEARDLLFKLLQPETPLIGHAIDNDLNVCRIIHPTIIDTVLLYPHPRGLPIRNSLKSLASRHLGRDIQTGVHGHDSREDSVTTGDLVRVKAREKWKDLNKNGWKFENGKLVPPG
ncbi:uncharacterized protein N7446_002447 [Penicillium canescens]|uniref:Exonuclease domain-containing protein n=1 Tax=Penicillium canescens TaxID=5083 RepID=A0AAD6IE49_PENCN|nr:uncharacterized protein N7446_002447 [Penicillium canescens]KAJ6044250.1 hypothetical protein N7460_005605 [Penicillium canescens]KAJ6055720.1 hypothetical protein N7444_004818 [Penicillium canescens]KAJ6074670.1 hypothetical protein N7446_002447 [Penicillium canescens]